MFTDSVNFQEVFSEEDLEEKIKKAYEYSIKHNIITRLDMPIEDHPQFQMILDIAEQDELGEF